MNNPKITLDTLEGVIFDIDGVLVDTEMYQWLGWVEALKPYKKSITKKEYLKYAGKQGDLIEAELLKDFQLSLKKNTLLEKKEILLMSWFQERELHLMPFAKEAMQYFVKNNIRLAAASGSPRDEALLKLEKTGLLPFFQKVFGGTDVKRGKPFPDIYLAAAKALGVNPPMCLAFEDTQYGVESAKAAGLCCFAIPTEYSEKQDFSQADRTFKSLKEATAFLSSNNN